MVRLVLTAALAIGCGAQGEEPSTQPQDGVDSAVADTAVPRDSRADLGVDSTTTNDTTVSDTMTTTITPPPPIEDTSFMDDYGVPVPGAHVEATIGPEGGELAGSSGTPLDSVKLVIPKGALSTSILFALDVAPITGGAPGSTTVSPYIRVGPDGVAFAQPARLTLPWKSTVMNPQLAALARIGAVWSSLLDPSATASTITASMRRTCTAAAALVDLGVPAISNTTKSGNTLFIDGSGFGLAPVYRMSAAGDVASSVKYGGSTVPALAWSDTSIAVDITGVSGTTTVITTPAGSSTFP